MSEKLLTIGDYINWAEPNQPGLHESCVQCGRKLGKNAYLVEVSIEGMIITGTEVAEGQSQGGWGVGSECAKKFDKKVLVKRGQDA